MAGGRNAGRVIAVTGAGSGIGRAAVERLVDEGASVVAVDLTAESLEWCAGAPGADRIATVVGSVTEESTNDEMVAVAVQRFGALHGVFLNAGVGTFGVIQSASMEMLDRALEVNVRGVALGIKAAIPELRKVDGGAIVVTGSTSGLAADPGNWSYNASKAAVINMARGAAIDLATLGIRVNAVCPGPTRTNMTKSMIDRGGDKQVRRSVPMGRWGEPSELAAAASFLLSKDASFITGVALPVDGGLSADSGAIQLYGARLVDREG